MSSLIARMTAEYAQWQPTEPVYCIHHDSRMAHEATRAVMDLPLPPELTAKIANYLYGHKWYPPQIDLTLSDEEDDITVISLSDSDDEVKPHKRKRLRRAVVYSDPESDSDSDIEMLN